LYRMKFVPRLVLCVLFALTLSHRSEAQTATATLRGRVHDPQGAPVAAAVVTITAPKTGQTRRVVTEPDGSFVASNLAPGTVDVAVAAQGFGEAKREGVAVEVGQTASIAVELPLETVRVNVNVEGGIGLAAVDTSRSVVDTVIPAALIDVLPLNGRNFLELSLLVPGNAPAPNFDPTKSNTVAISSAGQLGRGGNITIDGADNNDDVVGGPLMNVTQESVQEFQIATNRFTAETGGALRHSSRAIAGGSRCLPHTTGPPAPGRRSIGSRSREHSGGRWRQPRSGSAPPNTGTRMARRSWDRATSHGG
jgi:hypothetical protein